MYVNIQGMQLIFQKIINEEVTKMNYTKILVVDDDSNIRDMLKQYLENERY